MVDCLIILVSLLGFLVLSVYTACMSKRADNVEHLREETEAEDRMIFRMADYVAQESLKSERDVRAKAA